LIVERKCEDKETSDIMKFTEEGKNNNDDSFHKLDAMATAPKQNV